MRRLGTFPNADGLSQLLFRLTVTSTVFCLSEMSSPWGFRVAGRSSPSFHLLTSGSAWLEIEGEPEAVRLLAGDLVILPRGQAHQVRDSRESPVQWLDRILADTPPIDGRLQHGGGGERSELLCGSFAVDQLTGRPLLEALPNVVHLHGHEGRAPEWLSGLIRMIAVEMSSTGPGAEAVVSRLTDALLAQALRKCLLEADGAGGQSSAVTDPQIGRALRLIRERPEHPWSVPEIAAAVGMSRSAFAERFRAALGETPMQNLTRYRLARAAEYLRTTNAGIREIARLTGYDSEVSISKAFRRHFGTSPGAYRKAGAPASSPD
ncbi:MAG TPA: AraC family transcriptional regulator [Candidatus Dormibacteraeota bacterium]|nr:AraC family transcriptional regulator [Candidatus Dormibacteraeota bacterium]